MSGTSWPLISFVLIASNMKSETSFCSPLSAAPLGSLPDNLMILLISLTGSLELKIRVTIPLADNVSPSFATNVSNRNFSISLLIISYFLRCCAMIFDASFASKNCCLSNGNWFKDSSLLRINFSMTSDGITPSESASWENLFFNPSWTPVESFARIFWTSFVATPPSSPLRISLLNVVSGIILSFPFVS